MILNSLQNFSEVKKEISKNKITFIENQKIKVGILAFSNNLKSPDLAEVSVQNSPAGAAVLMVGWKRVVPGTKTSQVSLYKFPDVLLGCLLFSGNEAAQWSDTQNLPGS